MYLEGTRYLQGVANRAVALSTLMLLCGQGFALSTISERHWCCIALRTMLCCMPTNTVTFIGVLATDVEVRYDDGQTDFARFRLLMHSRRIDPATHSWTTSDRTVVSVMCRRMLARNVAASLRRGDPVVLTGSLRSTRREGRFPRIEVEAHSVGLDLSRVVAKADAKAFEADSLKT